MQAQVSEVSVLAMFTGLLPSAHGVANDVFAADLALCRKAAGGAAGVGLLAGTLTTPTLAPAMVLSAIPAPPPRAAAQPARPAQPRARGRRRAPAVHLPLAQGAGIGHYTPANPLGRGGGGRGGRGGGGGGGRGGSPAAGPPPAGMTPGQYQTVVDARNTRNAALQQQQLASPGGAHTGDRCHKCAVAGRDPHHDHLSCAFWICRHCKEAGHRNDRCPNPFAP